MEYQQGQISTKLLDHAESPPISTNYLIESRFDGGVIGGAVADRYSCLKASETPLIRHLQLDKAEPWCQIAIDPTWLCC